MIQNDYAKIENILVGTNIYNTYQKLTTNSDSGHKIIGKGEAASIALAKENNGILASNNLKDISIYVEEFHL